MKRTIWAAVLLILIVGLGFTLNRQPSEKLEPKPKGQLPAIRLIQATDLHFLPDSLTDKGSFFKKVMDSGDGKVMHYSEDLMKAFVEQVIEEKPDYLVLTGDLTLNGERQSHEALSALLKTIEAQGIEVIVMPGNHDLNNSMAVKYVKDSYEPVATVSAKAFEAIYKDYGYKQALARDKNSLSYVYALEDNVRLLVVDVNTKEAPGQLKPETLSWVQRQLQEATEAGSHVIALSHQNMLQHNALFAGGFVFEGSEALVKLYEDYGVLCNLSGHMHVQHLSTTDAGLTEAATASLAISPNQYAVIALSSNGLSYDTKPVNVAGYAQRHRLEDPVLKDFDTYASAYFKASSLDKMQGQMLETPNSKAIADYFAALNAAYFSGRGDLYPKDAALLDLPEAKNSFLTQYMKSILLEPAVDHNHMKIQ